MLPRLTQATQIKDKAQRQELERLTETLWKQETAKLRDRTSIERTESALRDFDEIFKFQTQSKEMDKALAFRGYAEKSTTELQDKLKQRRGLRDMDNYKNVDYIEEEEYRKEDQTLNIKQIILRHLKKLSDLTVGELTSARIEKKPIIMKDGVATIDVYHEDKRMAYINGIDFLLDMIMPYKDKPFEKRLKELEETEEKKSKEMEEKNSTEDEWIFYLLSIRRKLFGDVKNCA